MRRDIAAGRLPSVQPFHAMAYPFSPELALAISRQYAAHCLSQAQRMGVPRLAHPPATRLAPGERLRVAYVSSDFGNHPLSHLMGAVFGMHDRRRVGSMAQGRAGQWEGTGRRLSRSQVAARLAPTAAALPAPPSPPPQQGGGVLLRADAGRRLLVARAHRGGGGALCGRQRLARGRRGASHLGRPRPRGGQPQRLHQGRAQRGVCAAPRARAGLVPGLPRHHRRALFALAGAGPRRVPARQPRLLQRGHRLHAALLLCQRLQAGAARGWVDAWTEGECVAEGKARCARSRHSCPTPSCSRPAPQAHREVLDPANLPSRAEVGLPEGKVVYSCANQLYKVGGVRVGEGAGLVGAGAGGRVSPGLGRCRWRAHARYRPPTRSTVRPRDLHHVVQHPAPRPRLGALAAALPALWRGTHQV